MAGRLQQGKVAQLEREAAALPPIPLLPCGRGGCKNPAKVKVAERWVCFACRDELRSDESRKFCEARGLRTVEEMRAYCKEKARSFGRAGSFDAWTKNMTQSTVDIIRRLDGARSPTLDRLLEAGVVDGADKLIPFGHARQIAREARLAERARAICELQEKGFAVEKEQAP